MSQVLKWVTKYFMHGGIDMMGFTTFDDYWNYIDGNDPDPDWTAKFYDYVYGDLNNPDFPVGDYTTEQLEDKTYLDHNYFAEMKLNITPAPKVGIPVIVQSDDDPFGLTVPTGGGTCATCKIADDWETVSDITHLPMITGVEFHYIISARPIHLRDCQPALLKHATIPN